MAASGWFMWLVTLAFGARIYVVVSSVPDGAVSCMEVGRGGGAVEFGADLLRTNIAGRAGNSALPPMCRADTFRRRGTTSLRGVFRGGTPNCYCAEITGPAVATFRGEVAGLRKKVTSITYTSNVTTLVGAFLGVLDDKSRLVSDTDLCNNAVSLFRSLRTFNVAAECIRGGG